jgi:hypothetical protein
MRPLTKREIRILLYLDGGKYVNYNAAAYRHLKDRQLIELDLFSWKLTEQGKHVVRKLKT